MIEPFDPAEDENEQGVTNGERGVENHRVTRKTLKRKRFDRIPEHHRNSPAQKK